ncbi:hypothetical protein ACFQS7_05950 [Dankookia sp. GCM10030260]|uniref:hypothetical protein n=1 Tax=Dankookia sp. GCM10030260 TaxID=3273390 RepID=UPI0036236908
MPALPDDAAQAKAAGLRRRLADRDVARRLTDWLERRPQLGREILARGEPAADAPPAADLAAPLRARLTLLKLPARERVCRPNPPPLRRVPDALAQMRRMLAGLPQGAALEAFLPAAAGPGPTSRRPWRATLASTLVAGLELSRDGAIRLERDFAFESIQARGGALSRTGCAVAR